MQGILLAGGMGTRLSPITKVTNKHLLPIYDKPMIYYPLTTLMLAGIIEISILSTESGVKQFNDLLGDGSQWGLKLSYVIQNSPDGIADGINIALKQFSKPDSVLVILGDNIFYGQGLGRHISDVIEKNECVIWTQEVNNPENFGIANLNPSGEIDSIVEKPQNGQSNMAITGLYYFPSNINQLITNIKRSERGEYEITDILNLYLQMNAIKPKILSRGVYWLDAGTVENLVEVSQFVRVVQTRQGQLIGSPDEASWRMNYITSANLRELIIKMPQSSYKEQLVKLFLGKEINNRL